METEAEPSRNGQTWFSSEFMAKLPLPSRKPRFGPIQLFQQPLVPWGEGRQLVLGCSPK